MNRHMYFLPMGRMRRAIWMIRLLVMCLAGVATTFARAENDAGFRPGDRWVVLGDSITHSGHYHRFLEIFYTTRFPDWNITVFNAGIGGDTAVGALTRLDRDVLIYNPSVVSIMFGMNDVGRALYGSADPSPDVVRERNARIEAYESNLRELISRLRAAGARVILITPSPADDTLISDPPVRMYVNEGLARCADIVFRLGREMDLPVVDFFGPVQAMNLDRQQTDPTSTLIGRDRVHPGMEGHFLMANLFLRAQMASSTVSRIIFDISGNRMPCAYHGDLSGLQVDGDGLRFEFKAAALPFPVPSSVAKVRDLLSFQHYFNAQWIQVEGLSNGRHALWIDGERIGAWDAAEWAAGIDVGSDGITPSCRQAAEVARILAERQRLGALLSDVAFCELRAWGSRDDPVDAEEMLILLEPLMERELTLAEPRVSVMRRYQNYADLKAEEMEMRRQMESLIQAAREAARPGRQAFEVRPEGLPGPGLKWLCAGQSNMAMTVDRSADAAAIRAALGSGDVYHYEDGIWMKLTSANAGNLSAVAVSFATEMSRQRGKSVGVAVAAVGGTSIDAWLPAAAFPETGEGRQMRKWLDDPAVRQAAEQDRADFRPWGEHRLHAWGLGRALPGSLFECHIRPLNSVSFDGVLWYQGESNAHNVEQASQYGDWLEHLIQAYRAMWGETLPFVIVQLPEYDPGNAEEQAAWSLIQDTQQSVAEALPNAAWVDIRDLGDINDIHPLRKQEVGQRAAQQAMPLVMRTR